MKITITFLTCLAATTLLYAQPAAIKVAEGKAIAYQTQMEMEVMVQMGGGGGSARSQANGIIDLMPTKVAKKQIEWSYGSSEMHLLMDDPASPGSSIDTSVEMRPVTFVTDASGNLLSQSRMTAPSAQMQAMMMFQQGMQGSVLRQYFSPLIGKKLKRGQSWDLPMKDTISVEALGMKLNTGTITTYTFERVVDTLGKKAARVRLETSVMKVDGTIIPPNQGISVSLDGDGSMVGTYYYSTTDGLLIAGSGETEMNLRAVLDGEQKMVLPMVMKSKSSVVRK
jgi:hypothetical protein